MENGNGIIIGVVIAVVLLAALILLIWYVGTMNKLRAAALKVDEADSGIDVALTKRYDVLTKQLSVVKEYTSHESKTLFETIRLRSGMTVNEKMKAAETMSEVGNQFRLTAEAYPELKSSANYIALQNSITDVEEHLQAARRLYNANVTDYNTKLVMFPASIVANMLSMKQRELFQAEEYKRSDVEMKF